MKKVLSPEMWPEDVTVRPFRPAGLNNYRRLEHRENRVQNQGQREFKYSSRNQAQF